MPALGHKRTFCDAKVMSALPPIATEKADMGIDPANRFLLGDRPAVLELVDGDARCSRARRLNVPRNTNSIWLRVLATGVIDTPDAGYRWFAMGGKSGADRQGQSVFRHRRPEKPESFRN
jgi:hypothetical protein